MTSREAVAGIGGVFFKARDPKALAAWYREYLGIPVVGDGTYASLSVGEDGRDATGAPAGNRLVDVSDDDRLFRRRRIAVDDQLSRQKPRRDAGTAAGGRRMGFRQGDG